jgi:hypothetical protein
MFAVFSSQFPNPSLVLDMGATSESVAPEANFFEDLFPYKDRITAVGIEDAIHLETRYPGLKYVRIHPGASLPFTDSYFDVAFSNAVIEHIVNEQEREFFLEELLRVAKFVFLTTPNRKFPIELHTGTPLLHALAPGLFYRLLDSKILSRFYNSSNLKLLAKDDLASCAKRLGHPFEIIPVHLFGLVSNWILVIRKSQEEQRL